MALNFTDKTIDYARNPRHQGELEDPTAIGEVSNPDCGDSTIIFLDIDDNDVIQDARFETFGCTAAVAASSILTEMIIGKTVDEAEKFTAQIVSEELGGLPERKMHCSMVGVDALYDALKNYRNGVVSSED